MSDLEQVVAGAGAADVVNTNFRAVSPAAIYGRRPGAGGLSFSYYGGYLGGNSVADGAVTLAASQATIYIVAAYATGVVSSSTSNTNWNDATNYFRIGIATTGASTITGFVDWRQAYTPGGGGGGGAVTSVNGQTGAVALDTDDVAEGAANLYFTEERVQEAVLAQLVAGANITLTADTSGGITIDATSGGGTPGGSTTQVQYNNAGAFGAEAAFAYDQSTNTLIVDKITLNGLLLTLATATSGAGLRLPHGTAPTSPTNGDVWTTTAGLYARINGATVGPLAAGGGGGTPAGSNTEIQYNASGSFGSEAAFTYDPANNTLAADKINTAKGTDITRAGTSDIGAATGNYVHLTGTTTVTALGTVAAGATRIVKFTGAGTLTHNATSLILPGAANITTAANDCAIFVSLGSGNWQCIAYSKASGQSVIAPSAGASLTNFTGSLTTASPNNTVNAARLLVTGGTTDVDFVLTPKGGGAVQLQLADGTAAGGDKRGTLAVDLQMARTVSTQVASGQSSFTTGAANTASGHCSSAMGETNDVSGTYGSATGNLNTVSGYGAAAVGGSSNVVDAQRAVTLGGNYLHTRGIVGLVAFGLPGQPVAAANRRQGELLALGAGTNNATPVLMGSEGTAGSTNNQIVLNNNSVVTVQGTVTAMEGATGDVKGWVFSATVKRGANAAATALVGTPTVTVTGADAGASSWAVAIVADATSGALGIRVTGQAAKSIDWTAAAMGSFVSQ